MAGGEECERLEVEHDFAESVSGSGEISRLQGLVDPDIDVSLVVTIGGSCV